MTGNTLFHFCQLPPVVGPYTEPPPHHVYDMGQKWISCRVFTASLTLNNEEVRFKKFTFYMSAILGILQPHKKQEQDIGAFFYSFRKREYKSK